MSRIKELAAQVAANTSKVDTYLQSNHLPFPSFDADGPIDLGIKSPEVESARDAAINASLELLDLLQGPASCIRPVYNATSLQAIYRYDIARKVPIGGAVSFKELAEQCHLYEPDLRRILRFAMVFHRLFQEKQKGFVSHSTASRMLAEDSVARDGLGLMFDDFYPSFARTVDAMEKFKGQEPNETAFALAHNTTETLFGYLSSRPAKSKQFANAMKSFTGTIPGNSPSFLIQGYPWASLKSATVVDIGGSEGHISILLAQAFPALKLIVQDRPEVIREAATKLPPNIVGRISFAAHDFFTPQSVTADAYLFRWIFHDWPDRYVVAILRQLIPALKPGARVIVNDSLSPEPQSLPLSLERTIRAVDMIMLSMHNSREREKDEWQQIFTEADPRFGSVKFWMPTGAALAIIEAVWHG